MSEASVTSQDWVDIYHKGTQGVGVTKKLDSLPPQLVCRWCDAFLSFEMMRVTQVGKLPHSRTVGQGYAHVVATCLCDERTRIVTFADVGYNTAPSSAWPPQG